MNGNRYRTATLAYVGWQVVKIAGPAVARADHKNQQADKESLVFHERFVLVGESNVVSRRLFKTGFYSVLDPVSFIH
jgi:hypothetical protein